MICWILRWLLNLMKVAATIPLPISHLSLMSPSYCLSFPSISCPRILLFLLRVVFGTNLSGLYKGGSFHFSFAITNEYPHQPPKVRCTQKVSFPWISGKCWCRYIILILIPRGIFVWMFFVRIGNQCLISTPLYTDYKYLSQTFLVL